MENIDIYARQALLFTNFPSDVTVIGCGGVGSWVGLFCALAGAKTIHLYDPDYVDVSNLSRTPYMELDVGCSKVEALRRVILRMRPDAAVYAHFGPAPRRSSTNVLFDCTDNAPTQAVKRAQTQIRAGCDGHHITVKVGGGNFVTDETVEEPAGYNTPSWVGSAALAAAYAVSCVVTPFQAASGSVGKSIEVIP